jgi:putative ABC transport system ATP-binding protein
MSIISGTLRPDTGEVTIFGNNIEKMNEDEIADFRKKNVGFIFQQFNLIPSLNILENVSIPLLLNHVHADKAKEHAAMWLEKVGLKGRENELPRNLSGGQQQRVAIARALVHDPKLIVCDEPTSALDAENGEIVMEILAHLTKQPGKCCIAATHDIRIFKFATKVVTMNDGIIID